MIVTIYLIVIILFTIIMVIKSKKQNKAIRNAISELEREKNQVIGAPILNELSKVEALINDDKLKAKYDNWQNRFDDIRNKNIP